MPTWLAAQLFQATGTVQAFFVKRELRDLSHRVVVVCPHKVGTWAIAKSVAISMRLEEDHQQVVESLL